MCRSDYVWEARERDGEALVQIDWTGAGLQPREGYLGPPTVVVKGKIFKQVALVVSQGVASRGSIRRMSSLTDGSCADRAVFGKGATGHAIRRGHC